MVTYIQFVSLISQNRCHQCVYLIDADDFYFGLARKYLQRKKLGHFENPLTKNNRDHVFSNYHFPAQNLNKKRILFSELVQICLMAHKTSLSLGLSSSKFARAR